MNSLDIFSIIMLSLCSAGIIFCLFNVIFMKKIEARKAKRKKLKEEELKLRKKDFNKHAAEEFIRHFLDGNMRFDEKPTDQEVAQGKVSYAVHYYNYGISAYLKCEYETLLNFTCNFKTSEFINAEDKLNLESGLKHRFMLKTAAFFYSLEHEGDMERIYNNKAFASFLDNACLNIGFGFDSLIDQAKKKFLYIQDNLSSLGQEDSHLFKNVLLAKFSLAAHSYVFMDEEQQATKKTEFSQAMSIVIDNLRALEQKIKNANSYEFEKTLKVLKAIN